MIKRIGEALVREGVISPEQLSNSLDYQNLHGGRLGSNLVQLGYVSEERLATALGKMSLFPCADNNDLQNIPPSVIAMFSPAFAKRYEAVPFRKIGDLLSVAMVTPQEQQISSEINLLTGCRVKAYIVPEIVIRKTLDMYYPEVEPGPQMMAESVGESQVVHTTEEEIRYLGGAGTPVSMATTSLGRAFLDAGNVTAVANLVMEMMKQKLSRVLLLRVEGNAAVGWKAAGLGESTVHAFTMKLSLDTPSMFREASDKMAPFCGHPTALSPEDKRFFNQIGDHVPSEFIIYPVTGNSQTALLLYADNMDRPLGDAAAWAKKVSDKAALALKMLRIRAQLLAD